MSNAPSWLIDAVSRYDQHRVINGGNHATSALALPSTAKQHHDPLGGTVTFDTTPSPGEAYAAAGRNCVDHQPSSLINATLCDAVVGHLHYKKSTRSSVVDSCLQVVYSEHPMMTEADARSVVDRAIDVLVLMDVIGNRGQTVRRLHPPRDVLQAVCAFQAFTEHQHVPEEGVTETASQTLSDRFSVTTVAHGHHDFALTDTGTAVGSPHGAGDEEADECLRGALVARVARCAERNVVCDIPSVIDHVVTGADDGHDDGGTFLDRANTAAAHLSELIGRGDVMVCGSHLFPPLGSITVPSPTSHDGAPKHRTPSRALPTDVFTAIYDFVTSFSAVGVPATRDGVVRECFTAVAAVLPSPTVRTVVSAIDVAVAMLLDASVLACHCTADHGSESRKDYARGDDGLVLVQGSQSIDVFLAPADAAAIIASTSAVPGFDGDSSDTTTDGSDDTSFDSTSAATASSDFSSTSGWTTGSATGTETSFASTDCTDTDFSTTDDDDATAGSDTTSTLSSECAALGGGHGGRVRPFIPRSFITNETTTPMAGVVSTLRVRLTDHSVAPPSAVGEATVSVICGVRCLLIATSVTMVGGPDALMTAAERQCRMWAFRRDRSRAQQAQPPVRHPKRSLPPEWVGVPPVAGSVTSVHNGGGVVEVLPAAALPASHPPLVSVPAARVPGLTVTVTLIHQDGPSRNAVVEMTPTTVRARPSGAMHLPRAAGKAWGDVVVQWLPKAALQGFMVDGALQWNVHVAADAVL